MVKLEIATTEEFDKHYKHYGYEEFVRKALNKCADKKGYGLVDKVTLFDAEPSKRIFFKNEQGEEFTVRYFLQEETYRTWDASYTLYKDVEDETGSHGEEISCGYAKTHYVLTPEDIIQIEIERNTVKQTPIVTSATVTNKASCMNNTSYVDFTLNGSEGVFTIKYYDQEPKRGMIYPHCELYKYTEIPKETEGITSQILKILEGNNETLWDDKTRESM